MVLSLRYRCRRHQRSRFSNEVSTGATEPHEEQPETSRRQAERSRRKQPQEIKENCALRKRRKGIEGEVSILPPGRQESADIWLDDATDRVVRPHRRQTLQLPSPPNRLKSTSKAGALRMGSKGSRERMLLSFTHSISQVSFSVPVCLFYQKNRSHTSVQ